MTLSIGRILGSLALIVFVGAAAISATGAFFSDTETSTGNTFTAGELDLTIDNSSYGFDWNNPNPTTTPTGVWGPNEANSWSLSDLTNQLFFSFADLKPGDYGEDTISLHVQNNAYACMAFDLTSTPDNGINEPEADAGDVTDGADGGELQNYLSFLFWHDDGDNVLEVGEEVIDELSGLPGEVFTGDWLALAESGDEPLQADATSYIGKGWCFGAMTATPAAQQANENGPTPGNTGFTCDGSGDHNVAQTDGIVVDVHFYAVQSRNNAQFDCSSLPPVGEEEESRPVGAALASYDDPASCDAVVDDSFNTPVAPNFNTIQAAIDDAGTGAGDTICVNSGTYDEVVNVNKNVTIAGLGVVGSASVDGFIIDADNVTVTGLEVTGGNAEGTFAGFYIKTGVDNLDIVFNDINGPAANDGVTPGGSRGVINVIGAALSDILVENNMIREWTTGIYTNPDAGAGTPWLIRYNDIDDNLAGIGQLNGAVVGANEFSNVVAGSEAIGVDSAYDGGNVEFNNFLTGTMVNTYGVLPTDVAAANNFWSPSGGAAQTGGTDEVVFLPEAGVMFPHN